jgi:hypothetical protein
LDRPRLSPAARRAVPSARPGPCPSTPKSCYFMNAGHPEGGAPGRILSPANFGSRDLPVPAPRPALRGKGCSAVGSRFSASTDAGTFSSSAHCASSAQPRRRSSPVESRSTSYCRLGRKATFERPAELVPWRPTRVRGARGVCRARCRLFSVCMDGDAREVELGGHGSHGGHGGPVGGGEQVVMKRASRSTSGATARS